MKRIRYGVAMSLDGYIAGPNGEVDWIIMDPEIDFGAIFARFDTLLMGRLTYEDSLKRGGGVMPGVETVVVSKTLRAAEHPGVTLIAGDLKEGIDRLRRQPGKDIWLFGGGMLCRTLMAAGLVDGFDLAIVPVLLGGGVPFLPPPFPRTKLRLTATKRYATTGILSLEYDVEAASA